ncbi:hypothetical protein V8G54_036279 [Vigna mungo]|uniref:Uncharacterized protein n=1 Tax=Vigna mungo TaxID=3915 RepID=A0AAQ3MGR7_VIGMU
MFASSLFSLLPLLSHTVSLLFAKPQHHPSLLCTKCKPSDDINTSFFDNVNPLEDIDFNPPKPPKRFVAPPSFDDGPLETEDEIAAAYEELYGPAFSGVSMLGNDVFKTDALVYSKGETLGLEESEVFYPSKTKLNKHK